ncbi:ATP-binding protein [Spirosoma rhododendri]|uniref:histidine kinase n=1 Tax=Spirosoma rhododendri TaxID=2728024 RepID=A0A7L5DQW2_9BACT|nr:ATP-binding protein [Spirosoma rhododendri]QJD79613.1 PAS domain-containing protein [Spirosoma rhododendri]
MTGDSTMAPAAETAVQLTQTNFALQAANIGAWDMDIRHHQIWCDDRCKQLYGYHQDELIPYEQVMQYVHPDDIERVDQAARWALNAESGGQYDVQFRTVGTNDSQLRWLHCRGQAFFDEHGAAYRFSGVAQDITQQAQARQQSETSEQRFRNLVLASPTATTVFTGRDMVVQAINQPMLQIWGKDKSVLNRRLHDAMPELIGQPFLSLLQRVFDTGETYRNPEGKAAIFIDGQLREFWFNFSYNPLYNADGRIYGIIHTATDITEQVVARRQLAANEARQTFLLTLSDHLRQLTDLTQIQYKAACLLGAYLGANRVGYAVDQGDGETAVVTCNYINGVDELKGTYRYADCGPTVLAGFLAGQTIIRPDIMQDASLSPAEKEAHQKLQLGATLNKPLLRGKQLLAVLFIHYREPHHWSADELSLLDETAERTWEAIERARVETALRQREEQYRLLAQELDERVKIRTQELELANKELARSNDSLQQFAYVASHDLQEPLRKIQSFSTLLTQHLDNQLTDSGRDYIERITNASARMSTLIKDLLTYSRVSTRQQAFQPTSLDEIVKDVLVTLDWASSQRDARLDVGPLPVVQGDEMQLTQLFQNLLSNALKFTPPGQVPYVRVHSTLQARNELPAHAQPTSDARFFHRICVQDTGIGFDTKYLDRIFQVFQRLHNRHEFPGTGVGLAICQRVAENHGGAITADSRPGEGATFIVYLPA